MLSSISKAGIWTQIIWIQSSNSELLHFPSLSFGDWNDDPQE